MINKMTVVLPRSAFVLNLLFFVVAFEKHIVLNGNKNSKFFVKLKLSGRYIVPKINRKKQLKSKLS